MNYKLIVTVIKSQGFATINLTELFVYSSCIWLSLTTNHEELHGTCNWQHLNPGQMFTLFALHFVCMVNSIHEQHWNHSTYSNDICADSMPTSQEDENCYKFALQNFLWQRILQFMLIYLFKRFLCVWNLYCFKFINLNVIKLL